MAFINKKEEVIKLKLTNMGRQLLSRGNFRPARYAFFDDDIIYDAAYSGDPEEQNEAQDRIKASARRDVQHLTLGVETRYNQDTDDFMFGFSNVGPTVISGEFDSLIYPLKENEQQKILGYPLTNMSIGTQEAPRFDLRVHESEIQNSSSIRYESLDGARGSIAQLDFEPEYLLVRDLTGRDPSATEDVFIDNESFEINPIEDKIEFIDKTFLEITPENVIVSLEELNAPYLLKNFYLEVYEVSTDGNQEEILTQVRDWTNLFSITIDTAVEEVEHKRIYRNNLF
jgi:hypothetical protein